MQIPSTTEIVVLLVGLLMWLVGRRASRKPNPRSGALKSLRDRQDVSSSLIGRLTGACFGDRAKADRLVQYEKKRSPGITHVEAIQRALDRLQDDRSRS